MLADRYEVSAYAAQARSTALGMTPSVNNIFSSIYLGRTASAIWPTDPNNYSAHFWHSAEFRGDNAQMRGYWFELLGSEGFNLQ